jgi:cytochrome c biogenesis protein CcmG, thiol:disulfide interchange protein DsbE
MPSLRLLVVVLAALLAGLAAAAGALVLVGGDSGRTIGTSGTVSTEAVSGPPIRFAGTDVASGEPVGLGELAGRPVVVTVWASWCAACPGQADALRRFAAKHAETAFFAVATQEDDAAARAFLDEHELAVPTLADLDGRLAAKLGVRELPTTLFLTGDHRVASMWEGPATLGQLRSGLEAAKAG